MKHFGIFFASTYIITLPLLSFSLLFVEISSIPSLLTLFLFLGEEQMLLRRSFDIFFSQNLFQYSVIPFLSLSPFNNINLKFICLSHTQHSRCLQIETKIKMKRKIKKLQDISMVSTSIVRSCSRKSNHMNRTYSVVASRQPLLIHVETEQFEQLS